MDLKHGNCWSTPKVRGYSTLLKFLAIWLCRVVESISVHKTCHCYTLAVKKSFQKLNELISEQSTAFSGLLEEYPALSLPKPWCSIWRPEHFTTICLHKHVCRRYSALRYQRRDLWCFFFCLLDSYFDPSVQVCLCSSSS